MSLGEQRQQKHDPAETAHGFESLIKDPDIRKLSERKSGSLAATLPGILGSNVGISGETPIQMAAHKGNYPVVINEPCLIIREHPANKHE